MNNNVRDLPKAYRCIDTEQWVRKVTFDWFKSFSNPTYRFGVKVDVTDVVAFSHKTDTSFFINFLYAVSKAFNEVEALRLRYIDEKVVLFNRIDPTFTVKTSDGSFNNAGFPYTERYEDFYSKAEEEVARRSGLTERIGSYNGEDYGVFYGSCITSIDLESYDEPLNVNDPNSLNVPRVFWDRYRAENGRYVLLLSVTVSHILVAGEELSMAINLIRDYCRDFQAAIR